MGWLVLVRICYDDDGRSKGGKSAGRVTRTTTDELDTVGLKLSRQNTGLYQGYFEAEKDAQAALCKLVSRLFGLGFGVTLDHTMMTVVKAHGPLPGADPASDPSDADDKSEAAKKPSAKSKGATAKTKSTSTKKAAKAPTKAQ